MDVKSAFLNGYLNDEVYVDQPPSYVKKNEEHKVCRLKRALYGLKQAPRAWYSRIDTYFEKHEFRKCPYEYTLSIKDLNGKFWFVCLYVYDLIFTGNCPRMIEEFKHSMKKEFEMTDMWHLHYFLGIEVKQIGDGIAISQKKHALEVLKRFMMLEANPCSTPMEFGLKLAKEPKEGKVNSSIYRSLIIGYTTRHLVHRKHAKQVHGIADQSHWEAGKRVLRYIKGTFDHGILYKQVETPRLIAYCDSDYGGSIDDSQSISGYVFSFGSGMISWQSKKQKVVALSSAEAEYMSITLVGCQAIWMRGILKELKHPQEKPTVIYCDNKSAIALTKNPVYHGKNKHVRIKYHFIRELVSHGEVEVIFCKSNDQAADVLTKALKIGDFVKMKDKLGVIQV